MKNKYLICNIGCDDSNNFEMELTKQERDILIKVFEENNKIADYCCKPHLFIYDEYTIEKLDDYSWYKGEHCLNRNYDELKKENK